MGVPGIRSTVYWGLFWGLLGSPYFGKLPYFLCSSSSCLCVLLLLNLGTGGRGMMLWGRRATEMRHPPFGGNYHGFNLNLA